MDVKSIAALIAVRNYAFTVREDRNVFKKETYKEVDRKIRDIDAFLANTIIEFDLESLKNADVESKPKRTRKAKPNASETAVVKDLIHDDEEGRDSQVPLDFKEDKKAKAPKAKPAKSSKDLSDNDDADMIAKSVAKAKAEIASRKKAK